MNMVIKNGKLIDETGNTSIKNIYIRDGIIDRIADELSIAEAEVFDAQGNYILPGFIDLNCNICDPGYENKEDIQTVSKSAAKGGFTSITCQPVTSPVIDNKTVVTYIKNKAKSLSIVNIFPYGSMSKGALGEEMSEIGEMYKTGIVAVSDGNVSIVDTNLLRTILIYSTMFDLPVITFCENKKLAANGVINYGMVSTVTGLNGKPKEAEETFIARNLILAKNNKSRLHITHVSTKTSVELIRFAKSAGVNLTCDTCPHYFTLSEDAVLNYNTFAKVNPPLRSREDIDAIIEGLRDGTIDAISSGHSPTSIESKQVEFDRADFGISSIETAFALSYTALVKTNILSMGQLMDKMSSLPAKILKLDTKGRIAPGMDADFCIADDTGEFTITAKKFASKAKFSPHEGAKATGRIISTFVNGKMVYHI